MKVLSHFMTISLRAANKAPSHVNFKTVFKFDMIFIYTFLLFIQMINCENNINLNTQWNIFNSNGSIQGLAATPGGVYSALNSIIGDVLYGNRDIDYKWIGRESWTYYTTFSVSSDDMKYKNVFLVLHGVDTAAEIYLNHFHILSCNNMFVRYSANIKHTLVVGKNTITVAFRSPVEEALKLTSKSSYPVPPLCPPSSYNGECHVNMLRKMQASFSWDWGPSFPSVGLWKNVEIVLSDGPIIESVSVKTVAQKNLWVVTLTVWFGPSLVQLEDTLKVEFHWDDKNLSTFTYPLLIKVRNEQSHEISFTLPKDMIKLWWPNRYGSQALYKVKVSYLHSAKEINIGFRTINLIQSEVLNGENKGTLFYFEVNGEKIFAKGSNWIPSSVFPEQLTNEKKVVPLLEAAAAIHANMIRVWGGGVYESDMFYETCDRLGIMVWQDMMFACSMYPVYDEFLASVRVEIEQNIKRLQYHPSIVIWAGNNENEEALAENRSNSNYSLYKGDYMKLYVDTIKPIVKSIDDTRRFVTSSPSNDIGDFTTNPGNPLNGDVHYYNYIDDGWDYKIYPNPRFTSEYGSQSFPSFECLQAALPPNQTYWGSPFVEHRQHSPNGTANIVNQINKNLPMSNDIKDVIYLSQINQAMAMKTESEKYRRLKSILLNTGEGYTMGALYWQLNDVWQAPTWSSIDYCGNWKMLHYYARDFFAPIIVSPQISADEKYIDLYVVIDGASPNKYANLTFNVYKWSSTAWCPDHSITKSIEMKENKSFKALKIDGKKYCQDKNCFYTTALNVGDKKITPENFLFHLPLKNANYPETFIQVTNIELTSNTTAKITLLTKRVALFVWLNIEGIKGTFSKNGFHMIDASTEVEFVSKEDISKLTIDQVSVTWLKKSYNNTI